MEEAKTEILRRWQESILLTLPEKSRALVAGNQDRFANPLGHVLLTGAREVLDALMAGDRPEALQKALERIVRLSAVQENPLAGSGAYLSQLRDVVAEYGQGVGGEPEQARQIRLLEERITTAAAQAHHMYEESRKKIEQLKGREVWKNTHMLRRLAGS